MKLLLPRASLALLSGLAFLSPIPAGARAVAARPIAPGTYCLIDRSPAETGTGEAIDIGTFLMSVVVRKTGSVYRVHFWNQMPDSPAMLMNESSRARVERDGSLVFDFVDGAGNTGRGRVRPDGRVRLSVLKDAPDNPLGRNYGDYRVTRKACAARQFRRR
jgi:hypothetical protein